MVAVQEVSDKKQKQQSCVIVGLDLATSLILAIGYRRNMSTWLPLVAWISKLTMETLRKLPLQICCSRLEASRVHGFVLRGVLRIATSAADHQNLPSRSTRLFGSRALSAYETATQPPAIAMAFAPLQF